MNADTPIVVRKNNGWDSTEQESLLKKSIQFLKEVAQDLEKEKVDVPFSNVITDQTSETSEIGGGNGTEKD